MFNFRQKIFISYLALFLVFLVLLFPFASQTVKRIAAKAMEDRASEIISRIKSAPNNEALIRRLKDLKPLLFFRVSVITDEKKVLYDTHTKRILGEQFSQEYEVNHPEVLQAFREGRGYHVDYSELLAQKFAYTAKAFDFNGKKYVLRTAFPYQYVTEMSRDFEIGFLGLAGIILLLFSLMTWFIINHLTRPIQQIIDAIRPYQKGLQTTIPEIKLASVSPSDDFGKLANTLNSLSSKVQKHINTLTYERNEKESLLEALTEGVISVDRSMSIDYVNDSALQMLEKTREDLLDQNLGVVKQKQFYDLLYNCQQRKRILSDTMEIKRLPKKVYFDLIAIPKKENSGAILVIQDNSTHHQLLEMRRDFIANASHELKTPITIIRGFAETLHDNPDLTKEMTEEVTEKIVNNCQRMAILIKDLLTLSDIEHIPESRLIECDLLELVKGCGQTVRAIYPDAKIAIETEPNQEYHLTADANLLEMAFNNLLNNAVKYSNPPADITMRLKVREGERMEVSIADKGVGIPAEEIEQVFQRFYRVEKGLSKKVGGSGLGLSIVAMIIEKHFGKISVTSEEGAGATFTVQLPIKRELT